MDAASHISAIVPARNEEASIEAAVRSLAAQPEISQIIVVNDQSTDRTAAILNDLAAELPELQRMETGALPAGWVGKNYALTLGAEQASGEWLLFTDADAEHLPGSAARALWDAQVKGAALISYSPEQIMGTWWERAMIPIVYMRLAARFPFDEVNHPDSPVAAANGQYLMIRRAVYRAIGGHASVAGNVLEDVALARRAKEAGYPIFFSSGAGIVRVRMYRSFGAMWQGWTKNLYPLAGGTVGAVLRDTFYCVPWFAIIVAILAGVLRLPFLLLGAGFLLISRLFAFGIALWALRFPMRCILYYLPGAVLYLAALYASAWKYRHGRVEWKGRGYAVKS